MSLTKGQEMAEKAVETGKNVFITGDAGTGKSFVLRDIIEKSPEHTVVCAPTGIAALNVHGVTIHRLLSLTPNSDIIGVDPLRVPKKLQGVKLVIVDEISMCRSDLFIWLTKCLRLLESKEKSHVQLIVCGDFCQLPPVVTKKDEGLFPDGTEYAFNTEEWKSWHFTTIYLSDIVRQSNKQFSQALSKIRLGNKEGIAYISNNAAKKYIKNAITIVSRNDDAEEINRVKLGDLKGKTHIFDCIKEGKVTKQDEPVPEEIKLRKNARIVFAMNDGEGRFTNGSTGSVIDFNDKDPDNPLIKVQTNGQSFWLPQAKWFVYDYKFVLIKPKGKKKSKRVPKKVVVGKYIQFPFKLGYAVTVHKSQGQTYDAANIVPAGWTSGLLYVALSRVRDIANMYLKDPIQPEMVCTDKTVIDFYRKANDHRGGARKGAGRKREYAVKSKAMRVPDVLAPVLKESRELDKKQLQELNSLIHEFVLNHNQNKSSVQN